MGKQKNHHEPGQIGGFISDDDIFLFNEGTHRRLYDKLGAHSAVLDGKPGVHFAVWAPNAEMASVTGSFNDWDKESHPLRPCGSSGIWTGFFPGIGKGTLYKYHIRSKVLGYRADKADPFRYSTRFRPRPLPSPGISITRGTIRRGWINGAIAMG